MFNVISVFKYECDLCGVVKYKESKLSVYPDKWKRGATADSCFCDSCSRMLQEIGYNPTTHTFDKMLSIEKNKHGHWIHRGSGLDTCSVCNFTCGRYDDDTMDEYCSHCGAKMDGCVCK